MTTVNKNDQDVCVLCFVGEDSRISVFAEEVPTTVAKLSEQGITLRDPKRVEGMEPWRSLWEATDQLGNVVGHYVRTVPPGENDR